MNSDFNPKQYYEEIGALPYRSRELVFSYLYGFVISVILTLGAFFLALTHQFNIEISELLIVLLALVQFAVQVFCFLHLSVRHSRMSVLVLAFASLVILILVSGSIWIMGSLNNRMMPSQAQMQAYMDSQQSF